MPVTRAQAKGVDPPKPLVRRKRKPKTNTLSFVGHPRMDSFFKLTGPSQKEIAADLQTAHEARNHTVDAAAQVAVPNATNNDAVEIPGHETRQNPAQAGKDAGEAPAQDTRPDASNAAKNTGPLQRPHSADQGAAPMDNRPKPRPLAKNRTNGGGDGPDLATDRFNLSHRTQPRQSQDRDSQREQRAYETVPAVEDDEEPEYEFDDMPNTGYFDSEDILAMEEDEGEDQNDPFAPHAHYSSPPMRRAPTPDSDNERSHSRQHSVDSPPRHVERPGSDARGVSEERPHSRRQSLDSPTRRGPTPEYAHGRSPIRSGHRPPFFDPPQRAHSSDSEGSRPFANCEYSYSFNVHLSICQNRKYMMLNLEVTDRELRGLGGRLTRSAVMVGQWASDPDLIAVDEFESQLAEGWTRKKKRRVPNAAEAQGSSKRAGPAQSLRDIRNSKQARRSFSADAWCGSPSQRPSRGPSLNGDNESATASPRGCRRTRVSPLPLSSLPPSAGESDSDDSGNEYGRDRATKQRIRDKKLAVGRRVSPVSDADDVEDMQDFERAIEENGFDDSEEVTTKKKAKSKSRSKAARETQTSSNAAGSSKAKSKTKAKEDGGEASRPCAASSKRGKGKGKRKAPLTNNYIQDDEDRDEDGAEGEHTSGPVPTKIRQRVHEVYEQFLKEVETITKDCGKPAETLHQVLGTSSIKTPRAMCAWNMWQQYWAETRDKTQDTGSNLNAACRQALITACGIDDEFTPDMIHNSAAVYRWLPWLKEWHEKFVAQAVVNYREKNGLKKKLQQEMRPVIQTAHMIQKTYGVHVWGFVIDYRGDASYVFGAGDEFKEMRAAHLNIELRKRGMAAQALRPAEGLDTSKSGRDDFHHQWAKIMGIQLWNHCRKAGTLGEHESDPNKYQMKWGPKFLDIAFESKCRIKNYPTALEDHGHIIGRRFELKKIRAKTFKQFMPALAKANRQRKEDDDDTVMEIVPGDNYEASLPLEEQGDVPLVINLDGKAALIGTALAYSDEHKQLKVLVPIREYMQRIQPPGDHLIRPLLKHFQELLEFFIEYGGNQSSSSAVARVSSNYSNIQNVLQNGLQQGHPDLGNSIYCICYLNRFSKVMGQGATSLIQQIRNVLPHPYDHRLEVYFITEWLHSRMYSISNLETLASNVLEHFKEFDDPDLKCKFYNSLADYYWLKALSTGNTKLHSHGLRNLAWVEWNIGDYSAAQVHAIEAQRLALISADLFREAQALRIEAICCYTLGNYTKAMFLCIRAGDLLGLCALSGGTLDHSIMTTQAEIHRLKSEYVEARSIHISILEEASVQEPHNYGLALLNVAEIDVLIGAPKNDVQRNCDRARKMLDTVGYVEGVTMCDVILADLYLREGNSLAAKKIFAKCLKVTLEYSQIQTCCLERLGDASCWGNLVGMSNWTTVFLVHSLKRKENLGISKALQFLGDIFLSQNDEHTATNLFTVALEGFTQMDVHRSRAECMLRLGDISMGHSDLLKAVEFWERARPLFERSLQAQQVQHINERLAGISEDVLEQHRNNLACLAELNAPSGTVEELEDDLSDIEELDKVDMGNEKELGLIGA
ncbi:hypothetical protein B0H13DRAFT_1887298 [Mycena leptocephala]|nr:hypothetical protein B0H13DRAFT_1887298 [Mycena leptocephala]